MNPAPSNGARYRPASCMNKAECQPDAQTRLRAYCTRDSRERNCQNWPAPTVPLPVNANLIRLGPTAGARSRPGCRDGRLTAGGGMDGRQSRPAPAASVSDASGIVFFPVGAPWGRWGTQGQDAPSPCQAGLELENRILRPATRSARQRRSQRGPVNRWWRRAMQCDQRRSTL